MPKSKAECQLIHARRRALQRLNVDVSRDDLRSIVSMIQRGQAHHISKQSNRISIFRVTFKDVTAIVAYDKNRKTIVTFLTEDMFRE